MGLKSFIQKALSKLKKVESKVSEVNEDINRVVDVVNTVDETIEKGIKELESMGIPVVSHEDLIPNINKDKNIMADRMRPYNGQPWTSNGIRGAHLVEGLTHRDIEDCVALALLTVGGCPELYEKVTEFEKDVNQPANWSWKDLYDERLDYNKMDPVALLQNVGCFVERYQGIFPNVPKLTHVDDIETDESINTSEKKEDVEIFNIRITTNEHTYSAQTSDKDLADRIFDKTATLAQCIAEDRIGEFSDGYHTFNELYEYRMLYNALLFNAWYQAGLYDVHKSKKHDDGELCFGGEWFIVKAETPYGQISNHYELKDWDSFKCEEREVCSKYDGHTSADAIDKMKKLLADSK